MIERRRIGEAEGEQIRIEGSIWPIGRIVMPTYKTSGSQCAVHIEKANRVLQGTVLKRGISRSSHGGQREEEESENQR